MKLLHIGNVGYRFNSFAYSSAMAAKELGIEFHVAGAWTGYDNPQDKKDDEEKYGVIIHQIDFIRTPYDPRNIKAYKQVVDLIKRERIDIIHCNTPIGGVVGRLAGKKCGIKKVIYQAHGFHFFKGAPLINWLVYYPIERWLAHYTDALITINQEDYRRAQRFHLRGNGKVFYVPGVGIDLSQFECFLVEKEQKRKELHIPADALIIISVGDLNINKNNKVIIEAIKKIQTEKVHYAICGTGPLEDYLHSLAEPINNRVHFLGYRTDIKELLALSDIFVMPSLREGLSRSLMEAMACGLPCIASNIRGNKDLLDEKGGRLVNPKRIEEWTTAIDGYSNGAVNREACGEHNKQRIIQFSTQQVISEMKKIYHQIQYEIVDHSKKVE